MESQRTEEQHWLAVIFFTRIRKIHLDVFAFVGLVPKVCYACHNLINVFLFLGDIHQYAREDPLIFL